MEPTLPFLIIFPSFYLLLSSLVFSSSLSGPHSPWSRRPTPVLTNLFLYVFCWCTFFTYTYTFNSFYLSSKRRPTPVSSFTPPLHILRFLHVPNQTAGCGGDPSIVEDFRYLKIFPWICRVVWKDFLYIGVTHEKQSELRKGC